MQLIRAGIEPATFCVLGRCDNHYTTEPLHSNEFKHLSLNRPELMATFEN